MWARPHHNLLQVVSTPLSALVFPWFSEVAVSRLGTSQSSESARVPPALSKVTCTPREARPGTRWHRPWEEAEHPGLGERNLIFRNSFQLLNCVSMLF